MNNSRKLSAACAAALVTTLSTFSLPAHAIPIIAEILADPPPGPIGDANGDGVRSSYDDEFIELFNPSSAAIDIGNWTLSDSVTVRHLFPASTVVPSGGSVVVFGGGTPAGIPGLVFTASTGGLGLNNGGDSVILANDGTIADAITYGSEGGNNEALTRYPYLTGNLVVHSSVPGAIDTPYSPGTAASGTPYVPGPDAAPPTTVPEPAALMLLITGMIELTATGRIKRLTVAGIS